MKIVSLVPSITETLIDLGCDELVGRTRYCIHPEEIVKNIPVVGGTKAIHPEKIKELEPEVIIANREENVKEQIEPLMKNYRVWLTDVKTIDDNYDLIINAGSLIFHHFQARDYCMKLEEIWATNRLQKEIKVAYLIWKKPFMTVGGDTFVSQVLSQLGFQNIFENRQRYPAIELSDLKGADIIMLSTEPYPFTEKNIPEFQTVFPNKQVIVVDGEAFCWFGTHPAKCGDYYQRLLQQFS